MHLQLRCTCSNCIVQCFRPLGAGADAHRREGVPHRSEKATLLGQRTAVGYYRKGVHLQAIVVMEAQRLMPDDALIQPEAALLQALVATQAAGIQNQHMVSVMPITISYHFPCISFLLVP